MLAGSPRHSRSAATTLASALMPTPVATITLTTNSAQGSVGLAPEADACAWRCASRVGVVSSWNRLATAAGTARTRNSDHSRPKVSNVRPMIEPSSRRGPA